MVMNAIWIVLCPALAFLVQVFLGKKLPRQGDFVSVGAIFVSFLLACPIFFSLIQNGSVMDTASFTWISLPGAKPFVIVIGILVNNLTAIMLFMVTLCAFLIHLFSTGYMHGESRYHLFFAYISLFSAGMLGLVVSDNLLTFFMCWEIMGLCSYLLIGFYYQKPSAIQASLKAFMTTRIGDVCFFVGISLIYAIFGTSNFQQIYQMLKDPAIQSSTVLGVSGLSFIGFCLMMGTIGKSAQFPLQVWLPDAMEGPTPVSALIHAATMVAAGVFLLIRMFPLLSAAGNVLPVIAYVGAITAFLASLIALVQVDIKKVLAYSTISQLGYMVLGVGVGAFGAAFLHLITHACFKACLFLCSGSVIHSVHTQDMREMGGLRSKMPWTFTCMLIATLAISGVPCFSGFVSKDRILAGTLAYYFESPAHLLLPLLGFLTAGITAFYMFRLIFMTFCGHAQDEHKHHHAHEQPANMVIPLVVLAALSFALWFSGPTGVEAIDRALPTGHWYETAIDTVQGQMGIAGLEKHGEAQEAAHHLALIFSLCLAGLGIFLSAMTYLKHSISAEKMKKAFFPVHRLLWNKYYFDELYINVFIQKGLLTWNRCLAAFDDHVVDRICVDGWRDVAMVVKSIVGKFDEIFVDRLMVDGTGDLASVGGWIFRRFQTGRVQQYLILCFVVLGAVLLLISGH